LRVTFSITLPSNRYPVFEDRTSVPGAKEGRATSERRITSDGVMWCARSPLDEVRVEEVRIVHAAGVVQQPAPSLARLQHYRDDERLGIAGDPEPMMRPRDFASDRVRVPGAEVRDRLTVPGLDDRSPPRPSPIRAWCSSPGSD